MTSTQYSQGIAPYYDLFTDASARNAQADFVLKYVRPGLRVLDLGAGTGTTAFALAKNGISVTAYEPDVEMHTVLLTRLALAPNLQERLTALNKLPPLEPFDLCCSFAVLHLLNEQEQHALVTSAINLTKPGGLIVLDIPTVGSERAARNWGLSNSRIMGELRIEHYTSMHPVVSAPAGTPDSPQRWQTDWKFVTSLHGQVVQEINRTFDWQPLSPERVEQLLRPHSIQVLHDYADTSAHPYQAQRSKARLLVLRKH